MHTMDAHKARPEDEETPIFHLTKAQLWPIVEAALGDRVTSFDISIEHQVEGYYGYAAEKAIPTFACETGAGHTGRITVFGKWFHRTGSAESQQYRFLHAHKAPVPRMYGVLYDGDGREMLFLEHLDASPAAQSHRPVERFREFLALMARFNAIQPSQEYLRWLDKAPWWGIDAINESGLVLERIWVAAQTGDLGPDLQEFCSSSGQALTRLQGLAQQVAAQVSQMPRGLIHTDFSRENTGRRENGDLLVLDVEHVGLGPRFFDVGAWLGRPTRAWRPELNQLDLSRHYVEQYAYWGGSAPSLEQFLEDVRVLWIADILRYLELRLDRGLDRPSASPADCEERCACRRHLHATLNLFLEHYC